MPSFRSISGIRAGLRPAQRRLAHRPVAGKPLPVDPDHGVVLRQPLPPDLVEHARTDPLLQSAGAPRKRSRSRSRSTRSTASRPQHQQNRVHRSTVRHPRVMTAKRMRRPRRQQRLQPLPDSIGDPPPIVPIHKTHSHPPSSSFTTRSDFAVKSEDPSYRNRLLEHVSE